MNKTINDKIIYELTRIADALNNKIVPKENVILDKNLIAFIWEPSNHFLRPVNNINAMELDLLKGIDQQSETLFLNTLRFSKGHSANNALLWGARGTGKSSLVKSIHKKISKNNLLTLVEIHREDLETLPNLLLILSKIKRQFIIFCDDLSFDLQDTSFKSLKAVLEGGIEGKPKNVLFYATSNRRHLMSRDMIENQLSSSISPSESINENVSLSDRFGLWLGFHNINQKIYLEIIDNYVIKYELYDKNLNIHEEALAWTVQRGSRSGRVAWQYILDLAGRLKKNID